MSNQSTQDEKIEQQARTLVEMGLIERDDRKFRVYRSPDKERYYLVQRVDSGKVICNCAEFAGGILRSAGFRCQHIIAVKLFLLEQLHKSQETVTLTNSETGETVAGKAGQFEFQSGNEITETIRAPDYEKRSASFDINLNIKYPAFLLRKPNRVTLRRLESGETELFAQYEGGQVIIVGDAEYETFEESGYTKVSCAFGNITNWKIIEKEENE